MTAALLGADGAGRRPDGAGPARAARSTPRNTLTPGSALGLGIAMHWFSLLVLIPLAAIVATAAGGRLGRTTSTSLTNPQTWAAVQLTVVQARARHRWSTS